jgi:adenine-specific DNA-methyltransferase
VSKVAKALVARSKASPSEVYRLERPGLPDLVLKGGNRMLRLDQKLRSLDPEGAIDPRGAHPRVPCERLTNVWDDVPFQGLAREGNVTFSRNKKPERLLARVLASTTREGDWVLDPFLGSGTTAAVASTMGRRWVGIESGAHGEALAVPRVTRVVRGRDTTGMRRGQPPRILPGFGVYRA